MPGDFHARDPNKLGIRTRYLSKHKNSELNKQNIWFVKTGQRQNQNYTSRDPDAAFEVWSEKKILTHDTYYSNYFFRQVDFPSFLHLFALILFEKSLQIPKNIEKTKDVSTCKIPISPFHMRQWRKIVPFFPRTDL